MRLFDGVRRWVADSDLSDEEYVRVNLPRLTRPNLVARLYMLFTSLSTAGIAWWVPRSTISRIMETGGITPHIIIGTMLGATIFGFLDILANDVLELQSMLKADGLAGRVVKWLEDRRMGRCFLIGGCYLVLTYAGSGSSVTGTGWLLAFWVQMALCAGLLAWSLRALLLATVAGGRDAPA